MGRPPTTSSDGRSRSIRRTARHQWYSELLARMGRFRAADEHIQRALTLDPLSPVISISASATVQAARGDDAAAIELAKRASNLGMKDRAADLLARSTLRLETPGPHERWSRTAVSRRR